MTLQWVPGEESFSMAVMGSLHTGQAGPPWIRGAVTLNNHCSRAGHATLHTQLPSHLSGGPSRPLCRLLLNTHGPRGSALAPPAFFPWM